LNIIDKDRIMLSPESYLILSVSNENTWQEKNMNHFLTKDGRYIMKDYSLFVLKVRLRLEHSTIY
jgi:hypothetical protein